MFKSEFSQRLIDWQKRQGRHDLPWQGTRDAYRIWLSEIMLQQTQVVTVIPYYERFLQCFPTVGSLAEAPVEKVLELWSGLGYYARARNLHRCAQLVASRFAGQFPRDQASLASLPGIGRSTAAAICVFAFGTPAAILDGNVKRVLARCFGVEGFPGSAPVERKMWLLAESLLPDAGIETYTQGLMDLGATLCAGNRPSCTVCPMQDSCTALRTGRQGELPEARPVKTLPERETTLLLLIEGQSVLLERRPPSGIWGGLLSLPEVGREAAQLFAARQGFHLLTHQELTPLRHSFTHFRLLIRVIQCAVVRSNAVAAEPGWEWHPLADAGRAALPAPIRKILKGVESGFSPGMG